MTVRAVVTAAAYLVAAAWSVWLIGATAAEWNDPYRKAER